MRYKKMLLGRLSILGWCVTIGVIAIYFFLVVPDSFSGWEDYITYHLFFLLLFFSAERLLLPWITDRLYRGWWVCVYPFIIQFLTVVALVFLFSWLVGGIAWKDLQWNVSNLWQLLTPLLLPNSLAIVLFIARQGLQKWEDSERYQLQLLTQELSPHLVNSNLSKLRPLIQWNAAIAIRYVKQNNILFHYYLKHRRSLTIRMSDELKQVNNMLKMEEVSKQLPVFLNLEVDPHARHEPVPQMLLVNLLSNCFSYGISLDPDKPIQLRIWLDPQQRIYIRMSNHKKASQSKGYIGTGTSLARMGDILRLLDPHSHMHITQDAHTFAIYLVYRISI